MFKNKETRKEKKSETLEIRLSYSKKNAFMDKCVKNNQTASHVLRQFIEAYVLPAQGHTSKQTLFMGTQSLRLKLVFLGVMMVMGVSIIQPSELSSPAHNILFSSMDTNQDGFLTASDAKDDTRPALFALLEHTDKNDDGKLSSQEIERLPMISMKKSANLPPKKSETTSTKLVSFTLTGDNSMQAINNQLQGSKEFTSFDADTLQALAQKIYQHANQ